MEIANNIKQSAEELLKTDKVGLELQLPIQIGEGQFYLASTDDASILGHGSIRSQDGTEYKIGTKR